MGRTPNKHTPNTGNDIPEDVAEIKGQAAQELAIIEGKAADNVKALALDLGYDGPLDADSLQREVLGTAATLARAIFYHGAALLLLREATLHGDWELRLAQLPFSIRTARNYMTIAAKFKDAKTRESLAGMGTLKLLELAALDDGEIDALTQGESVRGITLGETEKMSHKELRLKLAEAQKEKEAADEVRKKMADRIDRLEIEKAAIQTAKPDEKLLKVKKEAVSFYNDAQGLIVGQLRQALKALHESGAEVVYMAGLVGQLKADMDRLRQEFDLPDLSNAADQQLADEVAQWAGN